MAAPPQTDGYLGQGPCSRDYGLLQGRREIGNGCVRHQSRNRMLAETSSQAREAAGSDEDRLRKEALEAARTAREASEQPNQAVSERARDTSTRARSPISHHVHQSQTSDFAPLVAA